MLLDHLNRIKIRYQFTGWLQYIPTAVLAALLLLLATLTHLLTPATSCVIP